MRMLLLFWLAPIWLFAQSDLVEVINFGDNPAGMKLFVHASKGLDASYKGVLLVLHGCTQGPEAISRESGWNKLADASGMLVIYAGQALLNNPSRCFNWFLPSGNTKQGSEVRSLMSMIDYVQKRMHIPDKQVFLFGVSAGACMALNLGSLYPERFAGIASAAGVPVGKENDPLRKLSAIIYNEKVDESQLQNAVKERVKGFEGNLPLLVLAQGGKDPLVNPDEMEAIVHQWLVAQDADLNADSEEFIFEKPLVERKIYMNNSGDTLVVSFLIQSLGHALPIDVGSAVNQGGAVGLWTKDVDFHLPYWIAKEFGWK